MHDQDLVVLDVDADRLRPEAVSSFSFSSYCILRYANKEQIALHKFLHLLQNYLKHVTRYLVSRIGIVGVLHDPVHVCGGTSRVLDFSPVCMCLLCTLLATL